MQQNLGKGGQGQSQAEIAAVSNTAVPGRGPEETPGSLSGAANPSGSALVNCLTGLSQPRALSASPALGSPCSLLRQWWLFDVVREFGEALLSLFLHLAPCHRGNNFIVGGGSQLLPALLALERALGSL